MGDAVKFPTLILFLLALSSCNETVIKNSGIKNQFLDPTVCGDQPISYASMNQDFFMKNCTTNGCHTGGSVDLTTYEGVKSNISFVKKEVLGNTMPPNGPVKFVDKVTLLSWINQGAPLTEADADMTCAGTHPPAGQVPPVVVNPPLLEPTYDSLKANVFTQNCLGCHHAGTRATDFSTYEAITATGNQRLFDCANPADSDFVKRLVSDDPQVVMPTPRSNLAKLTSQQVETIKTWIANGMPEQ